MGRTQDFKYINCGKPEQDGKEGKVAEFISYFFQTGKNTWNFAVPLGTGKGLGGHFDCNYSYKRMSLCFKFQK